MNDTILIPQTVFAGDSARLIVPLSVSSFSDSKEILILTEEDGLPSNENIIVKRVELNFGAKQLSIDFTAFKPGNVEIPPITAGTFEIPPMTVNISSILEDSSFQVLLSPAAKPLPAPGTFTLIIGGMAALIAFISIVVFLFLYGPKYAKAIIENLRVNFLISLHKKFLNKIIKELENGKTSAKESIALANNSLRQFLSVLHHKDYYSFSANDFFYDKQLGGTAATPLFSESDRLKFSSREVSKEEAKNIITRTAGFIAAPL